MAALPSSRVLAEGELAEGELAEAAAVKESLTVQTQGKRQVRAVTSSKEFGYIIDYVGVLGELDQALTTYSALEGFDAAELKGALPSIHDQVKVLPPDWEQRKRRLESALL